MLTKEEKKAVTQVRLVRIDLAVGDHYVARATEFFFTEHRLTVGLKEHVQIEQYGDQDTVPLEWKPAAGKPKIARYTIMVFDRCRRQRKNGEHPDLETYRADNGDVITVFENPEEVEKMKKLLDQP